MTEKTKQKIGIIGAMDEEVAKMKELLSGVEVQTIAGMDFYQGSFEGTEVVVVRSGIGKVNAGICVQILADMYHVTAVINTGIAGSLKSEINIGDIVLSTCALQHDMDAVAFGYPLGQIPRMEVLEFQASKELLDMAKSACEKVLQEVGVFEGRVLSGDQFISSPEKKQWLIENFGGYCTEMEGAAIAQAAYLNGIPFLIIRAISDKADDSAHMDYPAFEAMAIEHSIILLKEMMKEFV